ncbi:MAG: PAS domain-containing protein [Oligoflexales bacterium]
MGHIGNYQTNLYLLILDVQGSIHFMSDNFKSKLAKDGEKKSHDGKVYELLDSPLHAEMDAILAGNSEIKNKMISFHGQGLLFLQCSIFHCKDRTIIVGEDPSEVNNFHLIQKIQSLGKIGGWVLDVKTMSTYWTEQTYEIHELPPSTPILTWMGIDFYHPDYGAQITEYVDLCIKKSHCFDDILKFITAKKNEIWVRVTGSPVKDENGKVVQIIGTFQNVDGYVRLSEELAEKTGQLNDILDNSPGIAYQIHLDNNGKISFPYVSPKAFDFYDIKHEDFEKNPSLMLNMVHESDRDLVREKILDSAIKNEMFECEGRIVTNLNEVKTVKATSVPRNNKDGSVTWNGIVMDITKEKEMEKELNHQKKLIECSARLASLGEISAGIGHEINTPLAIILLKIDEIREQLDTLGINTQKIEKNFEYVDEAVDRINSIVKSLKHLSRDQEKNKRKTVNINEEIERSLDVVKELYRNNGITITYKPLQEDLYVRCPGSHVQQIVLNLISNAKDVLLNRPDPIIRISVQPESEMVVLTVTDNGPGIPQNVQDKIFLPFFTTKDVDKGTGIGLAMCYSLIKNVNGSISFETSEAGTSFKCKFIGMEKENDDSEANLINTRIKDTPTDKSHLKILLIDDDPTFLNILNEELTQRSFKVFTAKSGKLGLQLVKENDFDIILSDLRMPEMDGMVLFEEMKKSMLAKNSLKIIMSGDITNSYEERIKEAEVAAWLQKPFKIEEMMEYFSKEYN